MKSSQKQPFFAVFLAAGHGKRMRSALPKVLHECAGKSLISRSLDEAYQSLPHANLVVVVGHAKDQVIAHLELWKQKNPNAQLEWVEQPTPQRGTGHAVQSLLTLKSFQEAGPGADVLVLPGDLPLVTGALVQGLSEPLGKSSHYRLLTTVLTDPTGYGRVVRSGKTAKKIVEEKDASPAEKKIREVACSLYLFKASLLKSLLPKLKDNNAQKEFYLTDLISLAFKTKKKGEILEWREPGDLRGVNDLGELAEAEATARLRVIKKWAKEGVRFVDPNRVRVDDTVVLAAGVIVEEGAILTGDTVVEEGAKIGPNVSLKSARVGKNAEVKTGSFVEKSSIGEGAKVGPYAHLRPNSQVGAHAKIGNFVELKETTIGAHTSVAHLSYLGDATVGERVNIGCGFVTCNFNAPIGDNPALLTHDDVNTLFHECGHAVQQLRCGRSWCDGAL